MVMKPATRSQDMTTARRASRSVRAEFKSRRARRDRFDDQALYSFMTCPTALARDLVQVGPDPDPTSLFDQILASDSARFRSKLLDYSRATSTGLGGTRRAVTPAERARQTRLLMLRGPALIRSALLARGNHLISRPHALVACRGRSNLGDHHYAPVVIKNRLHVSAEDRTGLTYQALLLLTVQGRFPESGQVSLRDGSQVTVGLERSSPDSRRVKQALQAWLDGRRGSPVPRPFGCARCGSCRWNRACQEELRKLDDPSLIPGMKRKVRDNLLQAGVSTCHALAETEQAKLVAIPGIGKKLAATFISSARALSSGKPVWLNRPDVNTSIDEPSLFLDFESESSVDADYLIGVLIRTEGQERYFPFLAREPGEEGAIWRAFLKQVSPLLTGGTKVYHYHSYEAAAIRRLSSRHGDPEGVAERLLGHLVDLRRVLRDSVALPLESNSLKSVARWLGFNWTGDDASAKASMIWYRSWLESGDESLLRDCVVYNRDDCLATAVLADWLSAMRTGLPREEIRR